VDLVEENMRNLTYFDGIYGGQKFARLARVMDNINENTARIWEGFMMCARLRRAERIHMNLK
jgi:hypothetical protein